MHHLVFSIFVLIFVSCAVSLADPAAENFYYSNTVTEATEKFVTACNYVQGSTETITHPLKGLNNETLPVTVCTVGNPTSRSVIFTISGTHGIEGYAGSMAQISMLRGPSSMFPAGFRFVHLHMINPYGASYILKENEQNADQYKNFAEFYSLGYQNKIVEEMTDGIDLRNLNNETEMQKAFQFFGQLIQKYGEDNVNLALKTGQGTRPEGIAYFGPGKSWSSNVTEYVMGKYLSNIDKLLVIDWHTAVGPYGEWVFVPVDSKTEKSFKKWAPNALMYENDVEIPPGGKIPFTKLQQISNAKLFRRGIWEAGTYPVDQQTNAMFILRLHCRFYNTPTNPFCAQVITQLREYFYPQKVDWRNMTYQRINALLPEVLNGFANEVVSGATSIDSRLSIVLVCIIYIKSYIS